MSKIAHFRARIKRERKLIPEWTAERCRAEAADCRRAMEHVRKEMEEKK